VGGKHKRPQTCVKINGEKRPLLSEFQSKKRWNYGIRDIRTPADNLVSIESREKHETMNVYRLRSTPNVGVFGAIGHLLNSGGSGHSFNVNRKYRPYKGERVLEYRNTTRPGTPTKISKTSSEIFKKKDRQKKIVYRGGAQNSLQRLTSTEKENRSIRKASRTSFAKRESSLRINMCDRKYLLQYRQRGDPIGTAAGDRYNIKSEGLAKPKTQKETKRKNKAFHQKTKKRDAPASSRGQ